MSVRAVIEIEKGKRTIIFRPVDGSRIGWTADGG